MWIIGIDILSKCDEKGLKLNLLPRLMKEGQ
jgi:hypothetical protein